MGRMSAIKGALAIYKDAFVEAARALPRTWMALLLLIGVHLFLGVAEHHVLQPIYARSADNGFLMRLLAGFVEVGCVGLYLRTIEIGAILRRTVRWADIVDGARSWVYLWETIRVLFIFFIIELVLTPMHPSAWPLAVALFTLLFSTVPEQVYQGRAESVELLRESVDFMGRNWPEWLGLHIPAVLVYFALRFPVSLFAPKIVGFEFAVTFGPECGFARVNLLYQQLLAGPLMFILGVALLFFLHYFMLVRGFAYAKLSKGNRRQRAWQARMEGR